MKRTERPVCRQDIRVPEVDVPLHYLTKIPAPSGSTLWHLCDHAGRTVWTFVDYIIDCVDEQHLSPKTVANKAYALLLWHRFLSEKGVPLLLADDFVLRDFRTWLTCRSAPNCGGDAQARKRSANLTLRCVYSYYAWLQRNGRYGAGRRLLGTSECQITSSLLSRTHSPGSRKRYPLTFRNAGERSKHRMSFVPGPQERAALVEYFYSEFPAPIARRNFLIFELAWNVGWRRGSILSLTTRDFDAGRSNTPADLRIAPEFQKFGYTTSFVVPWRVASQVIDYAEHERLDIVGRFASADPHIFLSARTGKALTSQAVSNLFTRARTALGWPAGAGLHSWRRGFASAFIERELDARIELSLDTSGETIAMSLAAALGHESLGSQAAYVRDGQRRIRDSRSFKASEEIATLTSENLRLRAKIASLQRRPSGRDS